ncbi:oligosaccharide flippase family protein [Rathayibacter sp. VKM Ac-2754]|uniref:oligosaccharide flippase family protein n=1 Tax=Rathayibacter sp. VKM Ac-2754 TaxID=2609251 RepID=UPI0013578054|nr:oligosaccharide flippase family protein [Rathayibacter sp. VKM Ac-2754]MWV60592.1 oligosaccharide flippase family protein [Rathayibacter sp. VKM Ac-2754]
MAAGDRGRSMSSGVLINFVGNAVGPLAGLASAPILAHSLGVDGRGTVAGATAPFLLITTIATFGLPEAITFFVARSPGAVETVRRRGAFLVFLAGLVATVVSLSVAPLLAGDSPILLSLILLTSAAVVPTVLVAALRGGAAGEGRWKLVALERAVGPIVRLIAIGFLAIVGSLDITSATIAIAFSPILGGLAYVRWRRGGERPTGGADEAPRLRHLFDYGYRVWFGSIAGVLLMRIDQVAMVPLSSTFELGLYVVAVTIGELPLVVNTAVREVVFASDARSSEDKRLTRAARMSFIVCGAIAVALGATCPWWLPLAFGEGFEPALPTVLVLLLAVALGIPGSVAGAGLSSRGSPHLRSLSLVIACVVNIAVLLLLVPMLGALGAALATLIGNIVSSNFNVVQMKRKFGVPMLDFYLIRFSDFRALRDSARSLVRRRHGNQE